MWHLKNEIRKNPHAVNVVEETVFPEIGDKKVSKRIVNFQFNGLVNQTVLEAIAVEHGFDLAPVPKGSGAITAFVERMGKSEKKDPLKIILQHHGTAAKAGLATPLTYFSIEHQTGNVTNEQEKRVLSLLRKVLSQGGGEKRFGSEL